MPLQQQQQQNAEDEGEMYKTLYEILETANERQLTMGEEIDANVGWQAGINRAYAYRPETE